MARYSTLFTFPFTNAAEPQLSVVSYQLSVISTGGYFEIWGFGSMEEVFTIMCRFVQTLSRYYGYAFADN